MVMHMRKQQFYRISMAFCKLYCIEFNVYEEELAFSLFGEYVNHYIPTGLIDLDH